MAKGGRRSGRLSMTEKSVDTDARADKAWLLSVQRKLYLWSLEHPEGIYRDLWNWTTDIRNLRCAWRTIAANKGKRTPGIDGVTVSRVRKRGVDAYLERIRDGLRSGSYAPSPSRRVWIPKPRKPGEFRPLGITTVKDRIVQCAVKQIVEPLFEARFWHVSYGFRPGRSCHGALEHIRRAMRPTGKAVDGKRQTFPCQYVIETDIKSCFDQISHHQAMERIRRRSGDRKVNRLILGFMKAGVLSEDQFIRADLGTQQGGILSPLIANVALSVIEEKYERWVHHEKKLRSCRTCDGVEAAGHTRMSDRKAGRPVFFPIRYADDSVVLVSGTYDDAVKEKESLARYLKEAASLVLSEEKTHITATVTVTNRDADGSELVNWLHDRCGKSEEAHSVMKEDLAGGRLPCADFGANAAWWGIMILTFNLNAAMKQLALEGSWVTRRMKAMRFSLISLPGRVLTHARELAIRLVKGHPSFEVLLTARRRIMKLAYAPSG
jgi:group II intron reverse transcriptase/maturase